MSSTNGDVYSVYKSGGSYFIGGTFTAVGLKTGYATLSTLSNDYPDMDFPATDGQVYAVIPDGSGGWYVGGYFTNIGGVSKQRLAHVLKNKTVDPNFTANCNNGVRTIYKLGSKLYIGGDFTTVNGTTRNYAAGVNASTGALLNGWNPSPNYIVTSITGALGADTTFWLGGFFTTINGNISRPYLTKVNSTNGNVVAGALSTDNYVYKVVARGDSILVGGSFSRLGLKTDRLASITEGHTSADQTMPPANGRINCILSDGSGGWYVGGYFTQIGGVNKNYIAHILSNRTIDGSFTASCDYAVLAIVKDGNKLYIGGAFSNVNGTPRARLAQINATTGALFTNWAPSADYTVKTLALKDTVVLVGGDFTSISGKTAYRFGAVDKTDGTPVGGFPGYNSSVNKIIMRGDSIITGGSYYLSANYSPYSAKVTTSSVTLDPRFPATNGQIRSVVPDGSGNYYVGGSFTQIGGINRAYIAKLNSSFQVITGWTPSLNGEVRSMILSGTTLYIGGAFTTTNGVSRPYISALNTSNPGSNKTWNSSLSYIVHTLAFDGTSIYAGGEFTTVNGGTTRNRLAKFTASGNLDASWNPNANSTVEQLIISGTNIIAGGSFTTIGGTTRNYLALLNNTNGGSSNWATANSTVYALYSDGTTCYVGGSFSQLTSKNGTSNSRSYLGAITISNGTVTSFNPSPNSYVWSIYKSGSNIYYGGYFTTVGGTARNYAAASNNSGTLQSWDPSPNSYVFSLTIDGSNVFLGGNFTGFKERSQQRASAVKYANQLLYSWQPTIDGEVYDITLTTDKIVIGGTFDNVSGSSRYALAAFSLSGNLKSTNLNLTAGGVGYAAYVTSLFASGDVIYAGGYFDNTSGGARNDFVEANIAGSGAGTVSATNASPDNIVYAISVNGNTIVYGGDFGFSNYTPRNRAAIIRNASLNIGSWNPNFDYTVFDIAYNYNRIFVVGQFDNVNGVAHPGACAFNINNGSLLTWNPQLSRAGQGYYADLYAVEADSNTVYLGGQFDQVAGSARTCAAAVESGNASLRPWSPNPGPDPYYGVVRTIALDGSNILLGGDFQFCKAAYRNYAAKIDSATGLVNSSWNPGPNSYVHAITGSGNFIYLGGSFNQIAGVTRNGLAAVNANTAVAGSFDANIPGTVYTLAFDASDILYVGGSFTSVKGTGRNYAAALSTSSGGVLQSWNPNANNVVNAIAINGSTIFLGGNFTMLNGTGRNYLASVNNTNGSVKTFNPNLNSYVNTLWISGSNLYAGGSFTTVSGGGTTRNRLAAFDVSSGSLKTWNPSADNTVYGIAASSDSVYIGGVFSNLNGSTRNRLGAVRGGAGTSLLSFNPSCDYTVRKNYIADYVLLSGGDFDNISGGMRGGFAVYKLPGSTEPQAQSAYSAQLVQTLHDKFAVYPNPSRNGIVTVNINEAIPGKFLVTVTSLNGTRVFERTFETANKFITLNLSALANGVYNINVTGNKINWSSKVIIQR